MSKKFDKRAKKAAKRNAKLELKHQKKFRKMIKKDLKGRVATQDQLNYAVDLLERTDLAFDWVQDHDVLKQEVKDFLVNGTVPQAWLVMKYEGRDGKTMIQEPELTSVLGDQGERPDDVPMTQPDLRPTGRTGQTSHPDWEREDAGGVVRHSD